MPRTPFLLTPLLALLCLSGCMTVGPDYRGAPAVAVPGAFVRGNEAAGPAASAWWTLLGDAQLDALVMQALERSPNLQAAQARLRQARASLGQSQAKRMPSGSASALGLGLQTAPGTSGATTTQLYASGFDATWEADLFGGTRRAIEAATAESDAVVADLADAQVSLAAEVVQAYTGLRDAQQRRALQRKLLEMDQQQLALTEQRRERGVAAASDVERQLSQVESSRETLSGLDGDIAVSLDQLAVLTGAAPGALDAQLAQDAPLPVLPEHVEVGDPAGLLARRPDIRAAERRLASRQAQIGEKTADYFPKLSLIGDIGFSASDPGHLLRRSNSMVLGVPYLSWNLLDFGRTDAAVRQAEAGRDEAVATYQGTVLLALRDANIALSRYGQHRASQLSQLEQQASAQRSAALAQQRRTAGVASQLELLDAQRALTSSQQNTLAGQAELVKDFASLHKSLGLGWDSAN